MKRWIAAIVSFVLLMGCVPLGAVSAIAQELEREETSIQPRAAGSTWYDRRASDFAGGSGAAQDPFLIATPEQLAHIADVSAGTNYYYALVANINLGGYEWRPIPKFDGTLYGNGFQIQNMAIHSAEQITYDSYQGSVCTGFIAFAGEKQATVQDVVFVKPEVSSAQFDGHYAGVVAGWLRNGEMINVSVTEAVIGLTFNQDVYICVGGLVGRQEGSLKYGSYSGSITVNRGVADSAPINVGGICGDNGATGFVVSANVTACYSEGSMLVNDPNRCSDSNGSYGGGIAGRTKGFITDCSSTMNVTVLNRRIAVAGGLVGLTEDGTIARCYASGAVLSKATSTDYACKASSAGGLVGEASSTTICNCVTNNPSVTSDTVTGYSTIAQTYGELTTSTGRLIGMRNSGTIVDCYTSPNTAVSYVYHKRTAWQSLRDKPATHEVKYGVTDNSGNLGYTLSDSFLFGTLKWPQFNGLVGGNAWIYKNGRPYLFTEDRCSLSILYTMHGQIWRVDLHYFMSGESKTVQTPAVAECDADVNVVVASSANKHTYATVNYAAHKHVLGKEATCTEPQRCTICGEVVGEADAYNHVNVGPEPTCTAPQVCLDCGAELKSALPHAYEETSVVPPTCGEQGYSHLFCTVCSHEGVGNFVPAKGHVLDANYICVECGQMFEELLRNYDVYVYNDETGLPIEGATVTLGGCVVTTAANGMARFQLTKGQAVAQALLVQKNDYVDYDNKEYLPQPTTVITLSGKDVGINEIYCNSKDVVHFSSQINTKVVDGRKATFVMKGHSNATILRYELWQGDVRIAYVEKDHFTANGSGKMEVHNIKMRSGLPLVARMITDGQEGHNVYERELNVDVVGFEAKDNGLSFLTDFLDKGALSVPIGEALGFDLTLETTFDFGLPIDVKTGNNRIIVTISDNPSQYITDANVDDDDAWGKMVEKELSYFLKNGNDKAQTNKKIDTEFSVMFMVEFDKNGITNVQSRMMMSWDASYSIGKNFVVWVIPIYAQATFKMNGSMDIGIVGYDFENSAFYWPGMTMQLGGSVTLLGGLGCSVVSAGVYGEVGANITMEIDKELRNSFQLHMYGELGLYARAKIPFFKEMLYKLALLHGDIYLPNRAKLLADAGAYNLGEYQYLTRDYLEKRSEWLYGQSLSRGPTGDVGVLQESAYTYIEPQMVALSDGRVMMVYLDDDGTDGTNWQHLVYSMYDPVTKSWGAPVRVDDNACCDLEFEVVSDGTDVYIVYTEYDGTIYEGISDADLMEDVEVAVIRYDGTSFGNYRRLTNGGGSESMPQVAVTANGEVVAAWVNNPTNDMAYLTEENQSLTSNNYVVTAICTNGVWAAPVTVAQYVPTITTIDVGVLDGQVMVSTIRDLDCNLYTEEDRRIYLTSLSGEDGEVQTDGAVLDGIQFVTLLGEERLMWPAGGNLYTIASVTDTPEAQLARSVEELMGDYVVVQTSDNEFAVLFTKAEGNGSNVYAIFCRDGVWGEPVPMTFETGRYVDAFAATVKNGNVLLNYISTEVELMETRNGDETTQLRRTSSFKSADLDPNYNLLMGAVSYSFSDLLNKEAVELTVPVTNQSWGAVDAVRIQVTDSHNNVVYTEDFRYDLQSGEQHNYVVFVPTASLTCGETYTVTVLGDSREADRSDNAVDLYFWSADMSVSAQLVLLGQETQLNYAVTNKGNDGGNAHLMVFRRPEPGDIVDVTYEAGSDILLAEIPLGRLEAGQTISGFVPVTDAFFANGKDHGTVYLQVIPEGEDAYDFNDRVAVPVERLQRTVTEEVVDPVESVELPVVEDNYVYDLTVPDGNGGIVNNPHYLTIKVDEKDFAGCFDYVEEPILIIYSSLSKLNIPAEELRKLGEGKHTFTLVFTKGDRTVKVATVVTVQNAYRQPTIVVKDHTTVYDGKPVDDLDYIVRGGGAVTFAHSADGATWIDGMPTAAGIYTMRMCVAADGDYVSSEVTFTLTINKATRTVSPPRVLEYTAEGIRFGDSTAVDIDDGQIYYGYSTVNDPATVRHWISKPYLPEAEVPTTCYLFAKVTHSPNYEDAYSTATVVDAHTHNSTVIETVPPTCTQNGRITYVCTCGYQYTEVLAPVPDQHNYGEWVVTKEPAHHEDGERQRVCDHCGYVETQILPGLTAANGDVNDDGRINNRDVATLQKYLNEWEIAVHEEAADTDNDGRINNRDLGILLRYLNGMLDLPTDE